MRDRRPLLFSTGMACVVALTVSLIGALPAAAAADVTTSGNCVDGSGTSWMTKVVWGGAYHSNTTGDTRRSVNFAGWTTNARVVATASSVKTYSNGVLSQTLTRTSSPDYKSGTVYDRRNPANPLSAPGKTKVTVTVGRADDSRGPCTVTHVQPGQPASTPTAAARILGKTRSGLAWHSGAWVGGRFTASGINGFGTWRGRPSDVVTTYSPRDSYQTMMNDTWSITTWNGFTGRLNYGLTILPDDGSGTLSTIGAGEQDAVWTKVAQNLKNNGRGDSIVRVAWENNLPDWRWHVTSSNTAQYIAAFRRVVKVMRVQAPGLKFDFGVACGADLDGSANRLAPLTSVYPGDDVVDIIGCDIYDWWTTHATSDASWPNILHPSSGPGLKDVTDFARAHGKGVSFPEWGLSKKANGNNGGGDNAYFISAMYRFFSANSDVLAYECYFDEPDTYLSSSIYGSSGKNPQAAAAYARLW